MRLMLMGTRPFYAPEDEGADFEDADADDLGPAEDEPEEDEPTDPEAAEPDADEPLDEDEPLDPAPQPKASRASEEIRRLRERAQDAERRAQEAEAAVTVRQREQAAAREAERVAAMSPEEQLEYRVNQRLANVEFNAWDTNDKVQFEALANGNQAVSGLKDEVEATFRQMVQAGRPTDRTTIAKFLIGEKALQRAPAARTKGAKAAAASKLKNAARPANGRGDVPRSNSRPANEAEARRRRLSDIEI